MFFKKLMCDADVIILWLEFLKAFGLKNLTPNYVLAIFFANNEILYGKAV